MLVQNEQRSGLLAKKVGMRTIFDSSGVVHACTILQVERNVVMTVKSRNSTSEYKGYVLMPYIALLIAYGQSRRQSKSMIGIAKKAGVAPFKMLREFRVSEGFVLPEGTILEAQHFAEGQLLDISGITVGKGFQGGMKRYGFAGLEASHGVSLTHRSLGSTGNREDPGRVFPGKKMAGRMGGTKVTAKAVKLMKVYKDLLIVKGSLPGKVGTILSVCDAKSHPIPNISLDTYSNIHNSSGSVISKATAGGVIDSDMNGARDTAASVELGS